MSESPDTHAPIASGPPWILGHRGSPREAPENTLVSIRRALDVGCDGVEYDVHGCATGEAVLLHDPTLDRTTDAEGRVADRTLPELFEIDAGGWFHKDFTGEPLALLEEALELPGPRPGERPHHMVEIKDPHVVDEVARRIAELDRPTTIRVASFDRPTCLAARDLGLEAMLLARRADEDDRRFVRDERLAAMGVGPGGWRTEAGAAEWPCERWGWSIDDPDELLEACRAPLFGLNTNEPRRALAARDLVALAPEDDGPYPLRVGGLPVEGAATHPAEGEWWGDWSLTARVRNPLPFDVRFGVHVEVRVGAFEVEGLPVGADLPAGAEAEVEFRLRGGSWSPGRDPVLVALFLGEGGRLVLDTPLTRTRTLRLSPESRRLACLRERPGQRAASLVARRRGRELIVSIESDGGLDEPHTLVHLDGRTYFGSSGVRVALPEGFDHLAGGVPFSAGITGLDPSTGARVQRRWAGGLPDTLLHGAPGRLLP